MEKWNYLLIDSFVDWLIDWLMYLLIDEHNSQDTGLCPSDHASTQRQRLANSRARPTRCPRHRKWKHRKANGRSGAGVLGDYWAELNMCVDHRWSWTWVTGGVLVGGLDRCHQRCCCCCILLMNWVGWRQKHRGHIHTHTSGRLNPPRQNHPTRQPPTSPLFGQKYPL